MNSRNCEIKKAAPVLAHRNGHKNEPTQKLNPIVPLLRQAVKAAGVTLGVYILAALAVLNVPALVAAILIENALIGAYFKLEV